MTPKHTIRLALGLATSSALVLGLTAAPAQAASRTQSDSSNDVLVDDPNADYANSVYWRTDIEEGSVTATKEETDVSWGLDYSEDDTADGEFTRLARLRVETVVKKTRKKVKTAKTTYVVTYTAGSLDPLSLERVVSGERQAVACDDLYYESDFSYFHVTVANNCLGSKLYRVQATLETHSVDLATSTVMADSLQIKPVAY